MSLNRSWPLVVGQVFVAMGSGLFGAVLADGRNLGERFWWFISALCLILVGVLFTAFEEKTTTTSTGRELPPPEPSPRIAS